MLLHRFFKLFVVNVTLPCEVDSLDCIPASVRRRGKKHRLVVEVESLASSSKKMKKVDELSTKIRVIYLQQ